MKIFLIALFLLAPVSCFAQEGCDLDEAICAAQGEYDKADAALTQSYLSIVSKIKRGEYEDYLVSQESLTQSLQKAQKAWLHYRDENCEAYYVLMSGGTSKNIDRLECLTDITELRSQYLRKRYE